MYSDGGVDMSPVREAGSIFDGVILRSAVEEAIRSHAKKTMAKAADRLRSEAEEVFRAKLVAELGKIITASERTLELARREFSDEEEQVDIDDASSDRNNTHDGIHTTELHRTAAEILMEYRIIKNNEPKEIEANGHGITAPPEQNTPNNSPAREPELPRPNMNRHHGSEEDLLLGTLSLTSSDPISTTSSDISSFDFNASPSSAADESPQLTAKCESGDNKDWWRDNDDEEEEIP
ncbi:hypothetical protein GGR55DRAFT_483713 [Xylaria sp. FL0064]|nr:hypothetical protein GGR55DRAFT_483713 [Xylaria sp. FL0064]